MWVAPLIIVAGIVLGVGYFQDRIFHHAATGAATEQSGQHVWVVMEHPPGDRPQPGVPIIKEFGSWHLACLKTPDQVVPKVGYIQNFGVAQEQEKLGKPKPCHVFIMMKDPAGFRQTMLINFRYVNGFDTPELAVIYTTLGAPHVIFDPTGKMHDLTKKENWQGGFKRNIEKDPSGKTIEVKSQYIPQVIIHLGAANYSLNTMACLQRHCLARLQAGQIGKVGPVSSVVVQIPGGPKGPPRVVTVPADGLDSALADLERRSAS
jgi:hypothetical protein